MSYLKSPISVKKSKRLLPHLRWSSPSPTDTGLNRVIVRVVQDGLFYNVSEVYPLIYLRWIPISSSVRDNVFQCVLLSTRLVKSCCLRRAPHRVGKSYRSLTYRHNDGYVNICTHDLNTLSELGFLVGLIILYPKISVQITTKLIFYVIRSLKMTRGLGQTERKDSCTLLV